MAFDGNGNYTVPTGTAAVSGQVIDSAKYNTLLTDLQTALTKAWLRDGQSAALANLPMGGFKITGLANGTAEGDAVNRGQLDGNNSTNNVILRAEFAAGDALIRTDLAASTGIAMVGGAGQVVASITALRALLKTSARKNAFATGYYTAGDGGGGAYYYDAADTTTADNGGSVIVAADLGRWKLSNISSISIRQFGASPASSAAANNTAIQAAISATLGASRATLDLGSSGDFAITGLSIPSGIHSLTITGRGARLVTTSASPVFTVTSSDNIVFDGVRILGNGGASINAQYGIYLNGVSRVRVINCFIENVSAGVWCNNTLTGYVTGGYQLPNEISGNVIKGCFNGIYLEDGSAGVYGEYFRISNNTITDCLNWGVLSHAGNTAVVNNTINGNYGGVYFISTTSINGDHGMIVGNTINHNLRCGIYLKDLLRSMLVSNNNIWATLGDGTSNGYLESSGVFAESFAVAFANVHNVTFTGNILGRNRIGLGLQTVSGTQIANNQFITASDATALYQIRDFSDFALTNTNSCGPNIFSGTITGGAIGDPCARRTPVFTNSWVAYGSVFSTPAYWKDENNIVHLEGLIKSGTLATSSFTLPVGFRPVDGDLSFASMSNGAFGALQVQTSGTVTPLYGSNIYFSLDGISFKAA